METKLTDLWYMFDNQFKMPKADIFLNIYLNDENYTKNIKSYLLAVVWMNMFNKEFQETKNLA